MNNLQMSVLRYQLGTGEYPATPTEQAMTQEIEQLKLRAKQANQHDNQVCIAPTPLKCYRTGSVTTPAMIVIILMMIVRYRNG